MSSESTSPAEGNQASPSPRADAVGRVVSPFHGRPYAKPGKREPKPRTVLETDFEACLSRLWQENPEFLRLLKDAPDLEAARDALYVYLERTERSVFDLDNYLHVLEKAVVRECVRAFRSILGPINEFRTEASALDCLWKLARGKRHELAEEVSVGFLLEFIALFEGLKGRSDIYHGEGEEAPDVPDFLALEGREAALARTKVLDELAADLKEHFKRYPSGLEPEVIARRKENKARILGHLGGDESDWEDPAWQLKNVFRDLKLLPEVIDLTEPQQEAIAKAVRCNIPFGITPYYVSLMDKDPSLGYDHAIRAQVLPPRDYVDQMAEHRSEAETLFDFMGEHDTSPIDLVTRRYPLIAILKPFNTCAQICVYCQRNWEIDGVLDPHALAPEEDIDKALAWIAEHPGIGEILLTGGDPMVMEDAQLRPILEGLAAMEHVFRIRIGTRTPVVLPMRWTDSLMEMLSEFHEPPKREVAIVTHFEHSYEVTPEAMVAVQKIRKAGMGVYNQEVFTVENSRRFETVKLRRDLRSIGVDPYYTFNMKGKAETRRYMVPIARILQERKEEARLLPGLDRTDEPVFNVPRLGKNHIRSWQHHRFLMVLPNGSRVYEFHPWEKNITAVLPYYYVDVPIQDYLKELSARGEDLHQYRTIWYYY